MGSQIFTISKTFSNTLLMFVFASLNKNLNFSLLRTPNNSSKISLVAKISNSPFSASLIMLFGTPCQKIPEIKTLLSKTILIYLLFIFPVIFNFFFNFFSADFWIRNSLS